MFPIFVHTNFYLYPQHIMIIHYDPRTYYDGSLCFRRCLSIQLCGGRGGRSTQSTSTGPMSFLVGTPVQVGWHTPVPGRGTPVPGGDIPVPGMEVPQSEVGAPKSQVGVHQCQAGGTLGQAENRLDTVRI